MNIRELRELIRLIDEKKFAEFELEQGDFKIRIRRDSPAVIQASDSGFVTDMQPGANSAGARVKEANEAAISALAAEAELYTIVSPIVGTFYRAPSPTAGPFVEIGDHVEPQTPLCIIEAMKLMNEITSDVAGEVVRVYVESGQPVEYGQALFGIRC